MPSCTMSPSKTPRCCSNRGCCRHERCGATRIPTGGLYVSAATVRPVSRPKRRPRRFGTDGPLKNQETELAFTIHGGANDGANFRKCYRIRMADRRCVVVRASLPRGRVLTGQGSEGHRCIQGISARQSSLVVETRRQESRRHDDRSEER